MDKQRRSAYKDSVTGDTQHRALGSYDDIILNGEIEGALVVLIGSLLLSADKLRSDA